MKKITIEIIKFIPPIIKEDNNNKNEQKSEEIPLMKNENKALKESKNLFKTQIEENKISNENIAPKESQKLLKTESKNKVANKFNLFKTELITEQNQNKIVFNNSEEKNDENEKINNLTKKFKEEGEEYDNKIGKSNSGKNDYVDESRIVEKKILHEEGLMNNQNDKFKNINYNEKINENFGIINTDDIRNKNNYPFYSKNINNLEWSNSKYKYIIKNNYR